MQRWIRVVLPLVAAFAAFHWWSGLGPEHAPGRGAAPGGTAQAPAADARFPAFLPPEAVTTLRAIERGGPFPHDRDGSVFRNRERRLPDQPHGYYREYTVETPGSRDRGARRIVTGGQPPAVYYYTDDHYRTFRRVEVKP
jgi:guanyl-specific ribonuclease Sa